MKRIKNKWSRRDFMKTGAFISGTAAGAGLMVGANPELEAAPAAADAKDPTLSAWPLSRWRTGRC